MTHVDDLENLRKRAKQLVRRHRDGDFELPERIRRSLLRFAGMSDREVLAADFALHDAQELLAREHGFATWADLKEAPPMTTAPSTELRVLRALPQVFVRDVERAVAHYRDVLGFTVVFTYGEPPFYAEVRRGDAALNLRHTDASPWDESMRDREELLAACIATTDAKALYLELRDAGADIAQPLGTPAYGGNQLVVRDPDGNLLLFGSGTGTERSDAAVRGDADR